ncbi:neurogenic protein big brain-like [Uloborus diversus]|uniref:neurogenic protein big brain-like n=1 Tax=Uloborus diversus TaxID=327109 RepID=UPI002409A40D|nr:neurogenic protein big brain-like [Uloborus diversus]
MATVSSEAYLLQLFYNAERSRHELNKKKTMLVELRTLEFWRAIIAECLATFLYVFLVCGSHVMWSIHSTNTLTKSFTNGFAMATAAQCFGHISGAHINPAFTFAMLVTQKVTPLRAFLYITAQCGGAIAGSALLYGITATGLSAPRESLGCTVVNESLSPWQGVGLELVLTFVVAFTMCATQDPNRRSLGSDALAVGVAYLVCTLVALPATGASMNPARSLGPAFVMNTWTHHWVYWLGPAIGGLLAGLIYEYIFDSPPKKIIASNKDREDSERDVSETRDDSDSKCSSALSPRTAVPQLQLHPQQSTGGPYYRPLTPHENHRPQSRGAYTSAKYVSGAAASTSHQQNAAGYYASLPRNGSSSYRAWNDYGPSGPFKF